MRIMNMDVGAGQALLTVVWLALAVLGAGSCAAAPETPGKEALAPRWSPEEFIYTPRDIDAMRTRLAQEPADGVLHGLVSRGGDWLRTIREPGYLETMLPEKTPLGETWFSTLCPKCGKPGGIGWAGHRERGHLECAICKTAFPNEEFPETATYTVQGRTYRYHRGEADRCWHFSAHTRYKRVRWTMKANRPHEYLAIAYLLTGEKQYARAAADVMGRYALVYSNWFQHRNGPSILAKVRDPGEWVPTPVSPEDMREKGPGYTSKTRWIFDSIFLTTVASAYGMVRSSGVLTDAEHRAVRNLARETLEWNLLPHLYHKSGSFGNVHGWMYDTMIMAGRAFGMELTCRDLLFDSFTLSGVDLIHEAYDGPKGLIYACENLCDREGAYAESGGAYYQQIVRAIVDSLVRVKGYADPPGYTPSPKVAAYYRGPRTLAPERDMDLTRLFGYYRMITSGGEFPAINDSNVGLKPDPRVFFYAYLGTGDRGSQALFKALTPDGPPHYSGYGLHYLPTLKDVSAESVWRSAAQSEPALFDGVKSNTGIAVLRGAGNTDLYLNWDAKNSSHVQYEQLGLVLYAATHEVLLDFGYRGSGAGLRELWINRTIAHNTVTVDESVQHTPQRGDLERWANFGRVRIVQAFDNQAFSGVARYRRTVTLIDTAADGACALDLFEVDGGTTHDQSWLANGTLIDVKGAALTSRPGTLLGQDTDYGDVRPVPGMNAGPGWTGQYGNGYGFINNLRVGNCNTSNWSAEWRINDGPLKLRITGVASPEHTLIRGVCPFERDGNPAEQRDRKGPIVILRRKQTGNAALSSLFAAAVEPFREQPEVMTVGAPQTGRGIEAGFRSDPQRRDSLQLGEDGAITYLSVDGSGLRELILMGRRSWRALGWEVSIAEPHVRSGTILEVDGETVSLLVDTPLPCGAALQGLLIDVGPTGGRRNQFSVQEVRKEAGNFRVFVRKDLGGFADNVGLIDEIIDPRTFITGTYFRYYVWGKMSKGDVVLIGKRAFPIAEVEYLGWKRRHRVKVTLTGEAFDQGSKPGKTFVVSAVVPGAPWQMEMPLHILRTAPGRYRVACPAKVQAAAPPGAQATVTARPAAGLARLE